MYTFTFQITDQNNKGCISHLYVVFFIRQDYQRKSLFFCAALNHFLDWVELGQVLVVYQFRPQKRVDIFSSL